MTDITEEARTARRARHEAIPAEVAQEEAEAIEGEIAEKASTPGHAAAPAHRQGTRRAAAPAGRR